MGPRYSSDGATSYVISKGATKIAFDQSNVPGTGYIAAGPNAIAAAAKVPITDYTENVPITSADSVAIKLVDAAGPSGAVVLNFTPPEALVILQAAQRLNLEDRVKYWACSTPCNTDFLATSLGPKWNDKLFVNAELTPLDGNTSSTAQLYDAILKQYGSDVSGGVGSFSEMGFVIGEIATHALESITGPYTIASVSAALKARLRLQHRAALPGLHLRQLLRAHPEQHGLHGHAGQRQVRAGPGVHPHLQRRPADRRLPGDRRHRAPGLLYPANSSPKRIEQVDAELV